MINIILIAKNINLHYYGTGHGLLKKSKIVIGWNTTAVLGVLPLIDLF